MNNSERQSQGTRVSQQAGVSGDNVDLIGGLPPRKVFFAVGGLVIAIVVFAAVVLLIQGSKEEPTDGYTTQQKLEILEEVKRANTSGLGVEEREAILRSLSAGSEDEGLTDEEKMQVIENLSR